MTMSEPNPAPDPAALPSTDGRQSAAALAIARGASRCLLAHGYVRLPEVTLASGRRADLIALHDKGEIWIIEVKSSLADFRADQKWPDYRMYCDRFFFAVGGDFPREVLPPDTGLIVADRYGGEILRPAPEHKLPAARRRAILQRFARVAALRLHAIADPDIALEDDRPAPRVKPYPAAPERRIVRRTELPE